VHRSLRLAPERPAGGAIGLFLFQVPVERMAVLGFMSLTSMAVNSIFGLAFATLLTLIVVPLLDAVLFRRQDHAPA
jgi:multidrug efflux pump subunit AcrB